jgi:hypothetical protein
MNHVGLMLKRGADMNQVLIQKCFEIFLPETDVDVLGVVIEPGRINYQVFDEYIKIWDQWKIQAVWRFTDSDETIRERPYQGIFPWEETLALTRAKDGKVDFYYQKRPLCIKITTQILHQNSTRLMLLAEAAVEILYGERDIVNMALRRLGAHDVPWNKEV